MFGLSAYFRLTVDYKVNLNIIYYICKWLFDC